MWLTKLKTALVLEDINKISSLIDEMPTFDTLKEMRQAAYLLQESEKLIQNHKALTAHTLKQLKTTLDFMKSTQNLPNSTLNLKL